MACVSDSKPWESSVPQFWFLVKAEALPGGGGEKGEREGRGGSEGRRKTLSEQLPDQDQGQKRDVKGRKKEKQIKGKTNI